MVSISLLNYGQMIVLPAADEKEISVSLLHKDSGTWCQLPLVPLQSGSERDRNRFTVSSGAIARLRQEIFGMFILGKTLNFIEERIDLY